MIQSHLWHADQVSEARKDLRDYQYEAEAERSAADELEARADVMKADCATQLRAADALLAAIKQHNAASEVLAQARALENMAASQNVTTIAIEQQAKGAKAKVCSLLCFCRRSSSSLDAADVFQMLIQNLRCGPQALSSIILSMHAGRCSSNAAASTARGWKG